MGMAGGSIAMGFTIRGKLSRDRPKAMAISGMRLSCIRIREIGNLMCHMARVIRPFKRFHSTRALSMTAIKVVIPDISDLTNSNMKECLLMTISTAKVKSNTQMVILT